MRNWAVFKTKKKRHLLGNNFIGEGKTTTGFHSLKPARKLPGFVVVGKK
jgi:hypothetical protein